MTLSFFQKVKKTVVSLCDDLIFDDKDSALPSPGFSLIGFVAVTALLAHRAGMGDIVEKRALVIIDEAQAAWTARSHQALVKMNDPYGLIPR